MSDYNNLAGSILRDYLNEGKKSDKKKTALLEDPKKLDTYVGKIFQQVSPSKRIAKTSKYPMLTDRVDATIDDSHPFKGFGSEAKNLLRSELAKPGNKDYSLKEITTGVVGHLLTQRDDKGVTRLERAYQSKRLNDTSWFGEEQKAPLPLEGLPSYDEWRQQKFEMEQEATRSQYGEAGVRGYVEAIKQGAVTGLAAGAGLGAVFGFGGGAAPGGVIGAATGALAEAVWYPLRALQEEKSEWASARKYSDSLVDNLKLIGVQAGADIATAAAGSKILRVAKGVATAKALAKPTASNFVAASKTAKATEIETAKIVKNTGDARLSKLSAKGQEEALNHPDGLEVGIEVVAEKEEALMHAMGGANRPQVTPTSVKGEAKTVGAKRKTKSGNTELRVVASNLEPADVGMAEAVDDAFAPGRVPVRTGGGDEGLAAGMRAEESGRVLPDTAKAKPSPTVEKGYNGQQTAADIDKLENEMFGNIIKETQSSPVVKNSMRNIERVSQPEALTYVPDRKAIEELGETFGLQARGALDDTAVGAKELKEVLPDITDAEVKKIGKQLAKDRAEGKISITEEINQMEELSLRVSRSSKIAPERKTEIIQAVNGANEHIKKSALLIKGMSMFGVTAGVFSLFGGSEAEASVGTAVGKAAAKAIPKAKEEILLALKNSRRVVEKVVRNDKFVLRDTEFQVGLGDTADGGPSVVLRNLAKYLKNVKDTPLRKVFNPYQQFSAILSTGESKLMNNPGVHMASYVMSEATNRANGLRVMDNILRAGGIKTAAKEVRNSFKELIPLVEDQIAHDYHLENIGNLARKLSRVRKSPKQTKQVAEFTKDIKQQIAISRSYVKRLKPRVDEYHEQWNRTAFNAAMEHSSVRVFLAADDDMATWSKYPFMKRMKLTEEEMLTAGRIKRQMDVYKKRLIEADVPVRSGDYMHYTLHPDVKADMMERIAGDAGATPYLKNYSRSRNARPMMPDVHASLGHYVPDVERRLQTQAFWNSGWQKVMNKTRHIEPLRNAFQALKDGTKPIEQSFGNDLARWYTNYEVFKRLFLLPSAGLKHIVKLTGDMANLGVGATVRALPSSAKGVSWRIVENTPYLNKISQKHFAKNASGYDKLKKSLFDSTVPVQHTRFRLEQAGYSNYDGYFSWLSKAADKVNHAGGVWINLAELIDRGVSVEAGLRLAAKKGMSSDQALYGIYDTILKNNFLGREFTPRWLRQPKTKALFLFQTTPYKIMERRLVTAIRANRQLKGFGAEVRKATRSPETREKFLTDLRNVWKDMKKTEQEMKANIFLDVLTSEVDFYGNSAVKQFAKDMLITGAGTIAGAQVGMSLYHHFFHIPFLKSNFGRETDVNLAVSPAVQAVLKGRENYKKRDELDEFWATKTIKDWLGRSGPFPDLVNKLNRLDQRDIPEIYKDSRFKYLFSIPAKDH